ncbi:2-dehydro-3-deoxygalactonokinase [Variovorax paradoxus]|uniref:2-dehydro-3-deoxygalactonokinase n=1 Tax=Variovorax paradoxus TaxID=34073 RepID=A0AAW8ER37_VARPD|nr:2-dehydro-3-deoxygalactonokinase [Variovorax paradoxus]MDP9974674.1 2-dehydro-3-deoxygalactonokinase [Variovorax paradoxus]
MKASLIAIDWGTSNLRASLLDAHGGLLEARSAPGGVMAVPDRRFAEALLALCGDWIDTHAVPLIASGMIGSRQGWQEAPYVACPAGLPAAAAQLVRVQVKPGAVLHIVPGIRCIGIDGVHDVMRGEETQLWGAGLAAGDCCVLPGTHSKWAWMGEEGKVERFETFMTGEFYGLLTKHGILGRLMAFGMARPETFDAGVRLGLAQHGNALHVVFAARTAGLMGDIDPEGLPDYLSGILIGLEIASATARHPQRSVTLLGDDDLCSRYETALGIAGVDTRRASDGATTRGQWRVALQAGLAKYMA